MKEILGHHFIVDFVGCNREAIKYVAPVERCMLEVVKIVQATYLNHSFHQFEPYGVSGVILIAESHLSIHTWPEYDYAGFDFFTCGEMMLPNEAIHVLKDGFGAQRMITRVLKRGIRPEVERSE